MFTQLHLTQQKCYVRNTVIGLFFSRRFPFVIVVGLSSASDSINLHLQEMQQFALIDIIKKVAGSILITMLTGVLLRSKYCNSLTNFVNRNHNYFIFYKQNIQRLNVISGLLMYSIRQLLITNLVFFLIVILVFFSIRNIVFKTLNKRLNFRCVYLTLEILKLHLKNA